MKKILFPFLLILFLTAPAHAQSYIGVNGNDVGVGIAPSPITGNSEDGYSIDGHWAGANMEHVRIVPADELGTGDCTAELQAIIDEVYDSGDGAGHIFLPVGTYSVNVTIYPGITLIGAGAYATILRPYTDAAVIKTPTDIVTNQIAIKNLQIWGDITKSSNDGIVLATSSESTWVDNVIIEGCYIRACGRYGLYTYGTSNTGPFVQHLTIRNTTIADNVSSGLYIDGYLYETVFINVTLKQNGSGTVPDMYSAIQGGSGTIYRLSWIGGTITNADYPTSAELVSLNHAKSVHFENVHFEQADKMLLLSGSQTARIKVSGCDFASASNITTGIEIEYCKNCDFTGNDFNCTATMTNAIAQTNVNYPERIANINVENNAYTGVTTPTTLSDYTRISDSGTINAYRSSLLVDTYDNAATDNLDYIYDADGSTGSAFPHGKIITILARNGSHDVVVKHGTGNIYLLNNTDFTMDNREDKLTLIWDAANAAWAELSRIEHSS